MRRLAPWLLAAAALALVAAGAVAGQGRGRGAESPLPSLENHGPRGLSAAAAFLRATGRPVARLTVRGVEPPPGAVVLLAAPRAPLDPVDVARLRAHVEGGGTLVWALGGAAQPALRAWLRVSGEAGGGVRPAFALSPHPLWRGLSVPLGRGDLGSALPGALALAGAGGAAAALAIPAGAGEVIVLAGPEPFQNAHLGEGDAASLVSRLAARGPWVADERFLAAAGLADPRARALAAALAQALGAGLLAVLALGRRLGPVREPPADGPVRTARAYLASLAALYRRAGAEGELARDALLRLRRTLERRAGIPARLPAPDAAARLARRAPAAARALEAAASAPAGGAAALLAVTHAAAEVDAALGTRPRGR